MAKIDEKNRYVWCVVFLVCCILMCYVDLASCHSCWYLGYMSSLVSEPYTTTTKVPPERDNKKKNIAFNENHLIKELTKPK